MEPDCQVARFSTQLNDMAGTNLPSLRVWRPVIFCQKLGLTVPLTLRAVVDEVID